MNIDRPHSHPYRGFSLVEIAIAMVILGLLVGGTLIPLQARLQQKNINEAKVYMAEAKAVIFAYALRHQTMARKLTYYDGVVYDLPARRPYLPCPDIDYDGLEDRHTVAVTLTTVSTAELIRTTGLCVEQKGLLPWRTLGIKSVDPWGNRLTYRVDRALSDQLIGFDETVRADIFDYRQRLINSPNGDIYALRNNRHQTGSIVCSHFFDNIISGGCPNLLLDNILAGVVTDVTVTLAAKIIPAYNNINDADATGIIEGAAFVLVSHGANGYGAINDQGQCRKEPSLSNDLLEVANAFYRVGHPIGCSIPQPKDVMLYESLFVSAPISRVDNDDRHQPDDLVIWVGSNTLISALLQGGVLPVRRLDFLPTW